MCQPYWLLRHTSNTVKKVEEGFEINYYLNCKKLVKKLNRTPEKIMVKSMAIRDRKSTRLNSSHSGESRMPSSA